MSDLSKAAKKNAKRKEAKKKKGGADGGATSGGGRGAGEMDPQDMLNILKEQLEEAKAEKNHDLMSTLRDQVWVLSDLIKGVRTNIPDDELLPIIDSINKYTGNDPDTQPSGKAASAPPTSNLTPEEKKVRALRKKLQQIDALRERSDKGEKLEQSQLDKISSEESIKGEIEELETLMEEALKMTR